jgi:hypothetical protein
MKTEHDIKMNDKIQNSLETIRQEFEKQLNKKVVSIHSLKMKIQNTDLSEAKLGQESLQGADDLCCHMTPSGYKCVPCSQ